ncbi:MAG: B12-binding domain-containing radical SAM protein [Chitinophagales bacterium]
MADVLLTNTYFMQFDPKQLKLMQPYPPLATLYAANVLRSNNIDVEFFDNIFTSSPKEIFPLVEQHAGKPFVIYDDGFNYLTKMCLVNMRDACFEMISHAKKNNCIVIVSSSDATDHYKEYIEQGADFIINGEAEITLKELIANLLKGNDDHTSINGLAFKAGDKIIKTNGREVLHDLDALGFPAWQLVDMEKYKSAWMQKHGYFSLNITTTRGCPFKCNWCAKPIYGNRYNSRTPENVLEEIKLLINNYGAKHFWFCDDIFGLKPGWIKKFAALVAEQKTKFKYKIQCRADLLLDENNIADLAASGCDEIWVGAESGSQKILDAMDKGTTLEQIHLCTQLMKKHKIKPCFFLQFGYLGETKEDIDKTINMLFELMPHDIGISVSYPLPGTKFYDIVHHDLKEKQNWNHSDDLAMMFHSTYSGKYYKQLHRYIHKRFRKAQGLQGIKKIFSQPAHLSEMEIKRIISLPYFIPMSYWTKFRLAIIGRN